MKSSPASLNVTPDPAETVFKPFDEITVNGFKNGTVQILDGNGNLLLSRPVKGKPFTFKTGGALGTHTILFLDPKGVLKDRTTYKLDAKTDILDEGGRYKNLLDMLYWTMVSEWNGPASVSRYNGKIYEFFVCWLRDHVHAMKGMKYFYPNLKSAINLYAEHQREDGMIYDNLYSRDQGRRANYWEKQFNYGNFMQISKDGWQELKRLPVENDVEYLFFEGVYYTWKATGDTAWMKSLLDKMLKAVEYTTTSPYRWSEKYQLLKRGFTIDTWDFQSDTDTNQCMVIEPGKTRFGIMHGDNTGYAAGLSYLAEMLDTAGRAADAKRVRKLEKGIRERLDKLAWNGAFFRHHVPEDTTIVRDLGVDHEALVSLSNAYAVNRGITHKQTAAIVNTYEGLREKMPENCPGEWFGIFPPFERGFGGHSTKWHYVNGGILTIVAGELAHGAFENGREKYGVHTLDAMAALAKTTKDYLHCVYRGSMPSTPARKFTPLSLAQVANGDLRGKGAPGVRGWFDNDPDNDLSNLPTGLHEYAEIPFDVVDPAKNNAKACLLLSSAGENYAPGITLPVNQKAASIYLMHTTGVGTDPGTVTYEYADGSSVVDNINNGNKISAWYMPNAKAPCHAMGNLRLGWWGPCNNFPNVGCVVYGYNNPNPGKEIKSIRFDSYKNGITWGILGVTLCDTPVFFQPNPVSYGIPDSWGAAAVVYALIEGLAGVKDTGVAFDKARFAPRWESANVSSASATIKYEASGGYVSYTYRKDGKTLLLQLTGNGADFDVELLLPEKASVKSVSVNGEPQTFTTRKIQKSAYCCFNLQGVGVREIKVELK